MWKRSSVSWTDAGLLPSAPRDGRTVMRNSDPEGADVVVRSVESLPAGIDALVAESEAEGFAFLTRLVREWQSGANRFDAPGEVLLVASVEGQLAGVCGLNVDPFAGQPHVGRIRHLYVRPPLRRHGVGEALLRAAVEHAAGHGFREIRLRTSTSDAARFYERRGFVSSELPSATHVLHLPA